MFHHLQALAALPAAWVPPVRWVSRVSGDYVMMLISPSLSLLFAKAHVGCHQSNIQVSNRMQGRAAPPVKRESRARQASRVSGDHPWSYCWSCHVSHSYVRRHKMGVIKATSKSPIACRGERLHRPNGSHGPDRRHGWVEIIPGADADLAILVRHMCDRPSWVLPKQHPSLQLHAGASGFTGQTGAMGQTGVTGE